MPQLEPPQALQIREQFGDRPVEARTDFCLNRRHKDAGCILCVQPCPTNAIRLVDGVPDLDAEACVRCGICLHVCPTEVFAQHRPPEGTLPETLAQQPAGPLALACTLHTDPDHSRAPATAVVRHRRCLAALAVDHLLLLSQDGQRELWLDDDPCSDCPISPAQAVIQDVAAMANSLLQALERPAAIRVSSQNPALLRDPAAALPVADGWQPRLSRRGFFDSFRKRAVEAALPADRDEPPATGQDVPVHMRLPHRVPPARRRLLERLARLPAAGRAVATAGLPFADVRVDVQACSACGLCARFCPTAALTFTSDEKSFVLSFQPSICIDCGVCAVACPEDAVRFGDRLPASALSGAEAWSLAEGPLTECTICGAKTAARPDDADSPRCSVCRRAPGPVQPLRDNAGLLADLFARQPDPQDSDG